MIHLYLVGKLVVELLLVIIEYFSLAFIRPKQYDAESFHTKTVSKTHAVLENFRGV